MEKKNLRKLAQSPLIKWSNWLLERHQRKRYGGRKNVYKSVIKRNQLEWDDITTVQEIWSRERIQSAGRAILKVENMSRGVEDLLQITVRIENLKASNPFPHHKSIVCVRGVQPLLSGVQWSPPCTAPHINDVKDSWKELRWSKHGVVQ